MRIPYGWIVVAAGALMTCVAFGAMFSLAVFLEPIGSATQWSRAGISGAMTLNFLVMGVGGFACGALSDRVGARRVVAIGSVLLGLALVLASRAHTLLQFQLAYGVLVGVAASTFFAPLIATTTAWFDRHRSLAVSLVSAGVAPMAAVSIYGVEGLAGLGGRVVYGLLGDRYGAKRVLVAGLLIQAAAIAAYVFVDRLGGFYALATVFGATYGGVMPLYAVLARDAFGPRILGTVFGAATLLSSLGMAVGPLAGGWIFDVSGGYAWLFAGSAAVGLGAAAIALAFPPSPADAERTRRRDA